MQINNNSSAYVQQNIATTAFEVDKSRFMPQGELSKEALEYDDGATISFKNQSPNEAWVEYTTSTTGSMVEVSSTIPAGFKDVVEKLSTILDDNGIVAPPGMSVKHAIPEDDKDPETEESTVPIFIAEGVNDEALKAQIEEVLNSEEYSYFKDYFLALDKLTAAENSSIASARDALLGNSTMQKNTESTTIYGYEQDFSLKNVAGSWQMETSLEKVELLKLEKIATR